jgi:antitoxin PrlF
MTTATLTTKGQITIPKEIRDRMMLHSGDKLDFQLTEQGEVLLKPVTRHVDEVCGRLSKPGQKAVTPSEMDAAIEQRTKRRLIPMCWCASSSTMTARKLNKSANFLRPLSKSVRLSTSRSSFCLRRSGCWNRRARFQHPDLIETLGELLLMPILQFEQREAVQAMLASATDTNLDLPDALIAQSALHMGCDSVLTFDQKACRGPGFELLQTI